MFLNKSAFFFPVLCIILNKNLCLLTLCTCLQSIPKVFQKQLLWFPNLPSHATSPVCHKTVRHGGARRGHANRIFYTPAPKMRLILPFKIFHSSIHSHRIFALLRRRKKESTCCKGQKKKSKIDRRIHCKASVTKPLRPSPLNTCGRYFSLQSILGVDCGKGVND